MASKHMSIPQSPLMRDGHIARGAMLVAVAALLAAGGGALVKAMTPDMNVGALFIWRNFFSLGMVLLWFWARGFPACAVDRPDLHALRGLLTFGGLLASFVALQMIPLGNAVLLRSSSPVFVPILALAAYRVVSDGYVWTGVLVGLLGIGCIVKPTGVDADWGSLAGLLSGVLGGAAAISMWRIGRGESSGTQTLLLALVLAALSAIVLPWLGAWPRASDLPTIILIALTTTLSQSILNHATTIAPTDKVLSWGYLSVVFSAITGALIWGEVVSPLDVLGFALVLLGAGLASRRRRSTA